MDNALAVRDRECIGDGDPDLENLAERHGTFTNTLGQGLAFEKLHDEVVGAGVRADVVEMADVGMIERGDGAGLALHALLEFGRVGEMCSENFNGYDAIEPSVAGAVDLAHAARSERRLNFIWSKFRAGSQRHVGRNYSVRVARVAG